MKPKKVYSLDVKLYFPCTVVSMHLTVDFVFFVLYHKENTKSHR